MCLQNLQAGAILGFFAPSIARDNSMSDRSCLQALQTHKKKLQQAPSTKSSNGLTKSLIPIVVGLANIFVISGSGAKENSRDLINSHSRTKKRNFENCCTSRILEGSAGVRESVGGIAGGK